MAAMQREAITVTGSRVARKAEEEQLGDLKLYRVPEPVTVSAKGLKQVAFLDEDNVAGRLLYRVNCSLSDVADEAQAAERLLLTVNDKAHGLGVALPMGAVTFFEPSAAGELFVGEQRLRDYAEGQDIEVPLGQSSQVFGECTRPEAGGGNARTWLPMKLIVTNANSNPAKVRVDLGYAGEWRFRGLPGVTVKDGKQVIEIAVPGNGRRELTWNATGQGI